MITEIKIIFVWVNKNLNRQVILFFYVYFFILQMEQFLLNKYLTFSTFIIKIEKCLLKYLIHKFFCKQK